MLTLVAGYDFGDLGLVQDEHHMKGIFLGYRRSFPMPCPEKTRICKTLLQEDGYLIFCGIKFIKIPGYRTLAEGLITYFGKEKDEEKFELEFTVREKSNELVMVRFRQQDKVKAIKSS